MCDMKGLVGFGCALLAVMTAGAVATNDWWSTDGGETWAEGETAAVDLLDALMPSPQRIERLPGTQTAESPVAFVRGAVAGAPAETADQAYRLEIAPTGIVMTAAGPVGRLYAERTLAQLRKLSDGRLPCVAIVDWPQYRYRGVMIDSGRNWQPLAMIRDLLDFMADYKFNLFHWHLTDYWGWRLESRRVPELNTDAATLRYVGKRYSQKDFLSIVDYAAARGITVVPEFDVPGHTTALRSALGVKQMRDEKVRIAMDAFLDEITALVPPDRMPFIHLGTDEVWSEDEKVPQETLTAWARRATSRGHRVIGWAPGMNLGLGPDKQILMGWASGDFRNYPLFDMGWYIDIIDPFELLPMAAYACPFGTSLKPENRMGMLIGSWHDDFVGEDPYRLFVNNPLFPAIVLRSEMAWGGRSSPSWKNRARLPDPSDPLFPAAVRLERRMVVQRDKVLKDFRHPFAFLSQTDLRWTLRWADTGEVIARNIPQATVHVHNFHNKDCSFVLATNRTVIAEMTIRSDRDRDVGAWIGFTDFKRSNSRSVDGPTPGRGEWNRAGAAVELNGVRLPPPEWTNPGLRVTDEERKRPYFWASADCVNKIPFTDEEYYMRPPYPIHLKKGVNTVRLVIPSNGTASHNHWVGTFVPLLGSSVHPREVDGLSYE